MNIDSRRARVQKWEYMCLCPDSQAGYAVMLQEVGEEGWEAAVAWSHEGCTHILYKRPVQDEPREDP
jgi:hypothetical protein